MNKNDRLPKFEIVRNGIGSVLNYAVVQYNFGSSPENRKRARVTYISHDHEAVFPASWILRELRECVAKFIEENELIIEMEQTTEHRFTYKLHGKDLSNTSIDDEGRIYGKGNLMPQNGFISPSVKYRS